MSATELLARIQRTEAELARALADLEAARGQLATKTCEIAALHEANRTLARETEALRDKIDALVHRLFGRKSEKLPPGQLLLAFMALGVEPPPAPPAPEDPAETDSGEPGPQPRKQGHGRKAMPKALPVERVEVRPDPEDCVCSTCRTDKVVIGEESSRRYDYVPSSVRVLETARVKMACPKCKDGVVVAAPPAAPVEKGIATAGMIAHVIVSKSAEHQPLYRQSQILARQGADLCDSTLLSIFNAGAQLLTPVANAVLVSVLASPFLHADETPVNTKTAPSGRKLCYLWTYGDRRQVAYRFTPGRGSEGPSEVLEHYGGFVHKDGYTGYGDGMRKGGATYVACWAHARRKFFDALRGGATAASSMLALIARLYLVEDKARLLDDEGRKALRQAQSVPLLLEIEAEAGRLKDLAPPRSALGEALTYLSNQWAGLRRYVEHGMLAIDNNFAERQIKPVALGRRNWLFAGSEEGGRRAAVCYTLVNSCKLAGVDPFAYLKDVLERVGSHPHRLVGELTPLRWKAAQDAAR